MPYNDLFQRSEKTQINGIRIKIPFRQRLTANSYFIHREQNNIAYNAAADIVDGKGENAAIR